MKKQWYRLDNAALIFPAIMHRHWNNAFRVSVTFSDPVDLVVLKQTLRDLRHRFPTFFVRLRTGFFWNYLEEIDDDVVIDPDYAYPLTHMSRKNLRRCCIRVLYYENRVAVEFFHSVTDGTGGMAFVKNMAACYIRNRYGINVPQENGIVSVKEKPRAEEIADVFPECSAKYASREVTEVVYKLYGEPEYDRFQHLVSGIIDTSVLLEKAHSYNATITSFLSAVMIESVINIQAHNVKEKKQKPVKISVPIDLRRLYNKQTYRNFVLAVNVGVDPRSGAYTLKELCDQVTSQLAVEVVPQKMSARIAANVKPAQLGILKIMPLPIKHFFMGLVYKQRGESLGCLNISNLGVAKVPGIMEPYIKRFEFIIGVQYSYPNNCSVVSYGGKTYVNMIRNTKQAELEQVFFSRLVDLGIPVEIESNDRV